MPTMNIFMLGNGFDLHYDLPTKYVNFLHTMIFLREHRNPEFNSLGDIFGNAGLQDGDKDIKRIYCKYKIIYQETHVDLTVLQKMIALARGNCWFKFFSTVFDEDVGWIDFEKEIDSVLKKLTGVFTTIDNTKGSSMKGATSNNNIDQKTVVILQCFSLGFFEHVANHMSTDGMLPIKEKEREYFIFRECFYRSDGSLNQEEIAAELAKSLKDFSRILSYYMWQFVEVPISKMVEKKMIQADYLFTKPGVVFTFNYTNTFEVLTSNDMAAVYHVHGTTSGDPNQDNGIVLGINADKADRIDSINTTFLAFKKYYQRIVLKTDNSYVQFMREVVYKNTAYNIILSERRYRAGSLTEKEKKEKHEIIQDYYREYRLFVYGHSLNVTDKDAITELFGIADLIVVFYHSDSALTSYVRNLVSIFGKEQFDQLRISKRLDFVHESKLNDADFVERIMNIPLKPETIRFRY